MKYPLIVQLLGRVTLENCLLLRWTLATVTALPSIVAPKTAKLWVKNLKTLRELSPTPKSCKAKYSLRHPIWFLPSAQIWTFLYSPTLMLPAFISYLTLRLLQVTLSSLPHFELQLLRSYVNSSLYKNSLTSTLTTPVFYPKKWRLLNSHI